MTLVSSEDLALFESTVSELHQDLMRSFTLYKNPIRSGCPNSLFDPVNRRALPVYDESNPYPTTANTGGPFDGVILNIPFTSGEVCPVCNGEGYVWAPSGVTLSGRVWHVRKDWVSQDGEILMQGDVRVKVTGAVTGAVFDWLKDAKSAYIDESYYELVNRPVMQGMSTGNVIVTHWRLKQ